MGLKNPIWQCLRIHGKTVVHRRYFNFTGVVILHRMVCTMMAVVHLDRLRPERQSEHLMTKTNPKDRQIGLFQHVADHRDCVFSSCRRVARAIRQKYAVWVVRHHVGKCGRGWQDDDIAPCRCKAPQDIAFGTIVQRDNLMLWRQLRCIPIWPCPPHLVPAIRLRAGDVFGQIEAFQADKTTCRLYQCFDIEHTVRVVSQRHMRRAQLADGAG